MTLLAPRPLDTPAGWPHAAWAVDPVREPHQFTHAVRPGRIVALCGLVTAVAGGPWPADHEPWTLPCMRCPSCARAVTAETTGRETA